jgi:hypothetical protein
MGEEKLNTKMVEKLHERNGETKGTHNKKLNLNSVA